MVLSGIDAIDRLSGGFPRGRITEIIGPNSSGRTSVLLSALGQVTDKEEVCGLIDSSGIFDPASAAHMGVDLECLLWIRPLQPNIDQSLKATDLLLQSGGFGMIAVDFGEVSHSQIQRIPSSSWFRLQRAVENTPTMLLFLSRDVCTRTCASLVLQLGMDRIHWSSRLLHGIRPQVEILRSRIHPDTSWKRTAERFWIRTPHFKATADNPTFHNEGAPYHEF
jgi:hypothetical protein